MLASTHHLLAGAQQGGYAIGAFNVYNLEGVRAVISAADAESSPVVLQVHPAALKFGGEPLLGLCLTAAQSARVPVAVHLDHSASLTDIQLAMNSGIRSIMADGSHLAFDENVIFTRQVSNLAHSQDTFVEGELGRLAGTEDGLTVPEYESRLTDPNQAVEFVSKTGVDALAVCIGNVHGTYMGEPRLDFGRLAQLQHTLEIPLVLHGASGLPGTMVRRAIELGVCKLNVNTELRQAYLQSIQISVTEAQSTDIVDVMQRSTSSMSKVAVEKIRLFGSSNTITQ